MSWHRKCVCLTVVAIAMVMPAGVAWGQSAEKLDLQALTRLKSEAYNNPKVMDTVSWLTDIYGPSLTGSPQMQSAASFLERRMTEFGLSNVHRETYPFGRSWANTRFYMHEISPQAFPILGGVEAFTGGTNGWLKGEVVALEKYGDEMKDPGKLKGKFLLMPPPPPYTRPDYPTGRLTQEQLARMAQTGPRMGPPLAPYDPDSEMAKQSREAANQHAKWLLEQGVLATIHTSPLSEYGSVPFGEQDAYRPESSLGVPQLWIAREHFNRIARQVQKNIPVTLEMNVQVEADNKMGDGINVIGEIPGGDKSGEFVMLGGHYDVVFTGPGQGATDDLIGCATALEAIRLIKASGLKPRRTIRVGCWSGEEQGMYGSRAYVQAHFRDWHTGELKPEHAKLSVYFNLDNGAGAIRGIHARANEELVPIFAEWVKPLQNIGVSTITLKGGIGTDDLSFELAGLPGFQFLQDPLEFAGHSSTDIYERIPTEDAVKNSIIMAFFAWQAANRDEMLPRKPMPKPLREEQKSVAEKTHK
jgi:hypothetical protein